MICAGKWEARSRGINQLFSLIQAESPERDRRTSGGISIFFRSEIDFAKAVCFSDGASDLC